MSATKAAATEATATEPWRVFAVTVRQVRRLSPTFRRVTFTGPELDAFADNGFDQRIKLILPLPGHGLAHLSTGSDWYQRWRALPTALRNPLRTYTVRAARPHTREVDIDFALHGDAGPASRWAGAARPGDVAALVGPDAGHPGPHGGVEFAPPAPDTPLLLAGDETAVPAVAAILERMSRRSCGNVVLEVGDRGDFLDLHAPPGMRITWLARDGARHGSLLVPAVRAAGGVGYAWLAGESETVRALRRHLVAERCLDRRSVTFMGYWRRGRTEDDD